METKNGQKMVAVTVYVHNHSVMNAWRMAINEAEEFQQLVQSRLSKKEPDAVVFYYGKNKRNRLILNPYHISAIDIEHIVV